jgi:hypothetical protein
MLLCCLRLALSRTGVRHWSYTRTVPGMVEAFGKVMHTINR